MNHPSAEHSRQCSLPLSPYRYTGAYDSCLMPRLHPTHMIVILTCYSSAITTKLFPLNPRTVDISFDTYYWIHNGQYISSYVGRTISSIIIGETRKSLLVICKKPSSSLSLISFKVRWGLVESSAGMKNSAIYMCNSILLSNVHFVCLNYTKKVNLVEKIISKFLKDCIKWVYL